jgi:hypothetical protein
MWGPAFFVEASAYDNVRKIYYALAEQTVYTLDTTTLPPVPQSAIPINDNPLSMAVNGKTGELWGLFMTTDTTCAVGRIDLKTGKVSYDIPYPNNLMYIDDGSTYDT